MKGGNNICKLGDIIVIKHYKGEDGKDLGQHSFIVINDTGGYILGLNYTFVASVITSFKDNKKKKTNYKGNFVLSKDAPNEFELKKDSYVKADQSYYFNKKSIKYYIIGTLKDDYLIDLLKLILILSNTGKIKSITTNLLDIINKNNYNE